MKEDALESYRHSAVEILTEAYAADKLDMEEFEKRTTLVHNAVTVAEIRDLLADLPAPLSSSDPLQEPTASKEGDDGAPRILSILSERSYRGDWLEGGHGSALTLLGETRLDLRNTSLDQQTISLHVVAILGETRIVIPPDMRVENNINAVLAEVSVNTRRGNNPKRKTLRLSGLAVMGEIRVDVKER